MRVDHIAALKDLRHHVVTVTFPCPAATEWFNSLPNVSDVTLVNGGESVQLVAQADLAGVIQVAAQHHAVSFSAREPSLDEVFLRYYKPEPAAKG